MEPAWNRGFQGYYDFGEAGIFCLACMKCSVCGSEPNFDSRLLAYGKPICGTCYNGRKQEKRSTISMDGLEVSYDYESIVGQGAGFFKLIFTIPENVNMNAIAELIKMSFDKMNLNNDKHLSYEEHKLIFTWFNVSMNIDAFHQTLSDIVIGKNLRDYEVVSSGRAVYRYDYFLTTNLYDGTAVWRCIICGGDFDSESQVQSHQVSKHRSEITGEAHPATEPVPAEVPSSGSNKGREVFLRKRLAQLQKDYESAERKVYNQSEKDAIQAEISQISKDLAESKAK